MMLKKLVKWQNSRTKHCDFKKKKNSSEKINFFLSVFFKKKLTAIHGARVRESVFKIKFRCLIIEFESVETSPGFAWLLLENLV